MFLLGLPADEMRNFYIDRLKAERRRRTRVCLLEYPKDDTETRSRMIENPEELDNIMSSLRVETSLKLRLFVVEDLSREVIEALGYHLKIDPSFFRDHITESQWDQIGRSGRHILVLLPHAYDFQHR